MVSSRLTGLLLVILVLIMGAENMEALAKENFEVIGVPVKRAGFKGCIVGPDSTGEKDLLYFNFNQIGGTLFIVAVDPETGKSTQYNAPEGPGAWAFIKGPDDKIYLGTWDGGLILRFDPKSPDRGIEVVGKPSETETYIWMYTIGHDGKLYGCTYPSAKIVSYDPKTGEMADLGRMDDTQMYTRSIATGPDGRIYVGVGYGKANIVAYDPETGEHWSVLPDEHRSEKSGYVMSSEGGNVYAVVGESWFRIEDGVMVPVDRSDYPGEKPLVLRNGHMIKDVAGTSYTIYDPETDRSEQHSFTYEGSGSIVFMVGSGPYGRIYGSSAMPLVLFEYDPQSGSLKDLGNPTDVDGEIYSMVELDDKLYVCAYTGSWLSVYDPLKPWNYGKEPDSNPRGIGYAGDGHLRPRAMIVGPDGRIFIGSLPPYGELGGALGCYDPDSDSFVENYRNLIPDQSIVSLVYEPESGIIFGGSSIAGGGGTSPVEEDAHFFGWDPAAKKKVIDIVPVPGDGRIVAMAAANGKVFAVSLFSNTLFVYDPKLEHIVHTAHIPYGFVHEISLGLCKDGFIYGLAGNTVFRIDPESYSTEKIAEYPDGINCGFAVNDTGIYFGSGVRLVRYSWD